MRLFQWLRGLFCYHEWIQDDPSVEQLTQIDNCVRTVEYPRCFQGASMPRTINTFAASGNRVGYCKHLFDRCCIKCGKIQLLLTKYIESKSDRQSQIETAKLRLRLVRGKSDGEDMKGSMSLVTTK